MRDRTRCTKCGIDKDADKFAWKNRAAGKRASECKECHKEVRNRHYARNKEKTKQAVAQRKRELRRRVYEYLLSHSCVKCDEDDPVLLDFDHRDRATKEIDVSQTATYGWSWERTKKEIAKCDVLCVRCHRLKTAREESWYADFKTRV